VRRITKNIKCMKTKKNISLLVGLLIINSGLIFGQDTTAVETTPVNKPVKRTFENQVLINNQTVENPAKKSLDFAIQHRFGIIENEDDLFGLYAPSNIRLALTYGVTDRFAVGLGATKNKHLYDLQYKYILLKQTKPKGIPVTVSYFGDVARSGSDESNFINEENQYTAHDRFSYFHEIMVARKINSHLSLQVAGTYSYFNIVDTVMKEHGYFGMSFVGRYQFSPQSSLIVDFDIPFTTWGETTVTETSPTSVTSSTEYFPKYNFGIGYEVSTSSHQFQIFVCSANNIINQEIRVFNRNDFFKGDILLGFNITRTWGF
jgi:hypothetical protein